MLTQDDLNMIKERAKKATPGPWYADDERWPGNANLQYWFDTHYDGVGAAATKADAEFIAHAREDIPRLVAEVERLRLAIREIQDITEDFNLENPEVRLRVNSLPVRGHLHVIYWIATEAITND